VQHLLLGGGLVGIAGEVGAGVARDMADALADLAGRDLDAAAVGPRIGISASTSNLTMRMLNFFFR
jgi:hypothetical protein